MNTELKELYFKSKEELDIIRSNATLAKWKVLSRTYKLGKQIWGSKFSKHQLSFDMGLPYTTTIRCLSLDRANITSWKLHDAGKISTFKLAMICQQKDVTYQDEIIDMVIKDNLSTYQIKSLKVNQLDDVNKERHRLATEKGYSRTSSAARNFELWIERGKLFLLMNEAALTKKKQKEIKIQLKELNKGIDSYING